MYDRQSINTLTKSFILVNKLVVYTEALFIRTLFLQYLRFIQIGYIKEDNNFLQLLM